MKLHPAKLSLGCAMMVLFALGGCDFGTPPGPKAGPGGTEGEGLTGILLDPGGMAVVHALVHVYPDSSEALAKIPDAPRHDSVYTNSTGRFNFENLAAGRYNLSTSVQRGDTSLSLFVEHIQYVGGLHDLGSNTLVIGGTLVLRVQAGGASVTGTLCRIAGSLFQAVVNDSGVCTLVGVPPGKAQIEVSNPGYHTSVSDTLTVKSGRIINGGSVELIDTAQPAANIPQGQHFALRSSTVALWTFNEISGGRFKDAGPNGYAVTAPAGMALSASPHGKAAVFAGKSLAVPDKTPLSLKETGLITYEARIWMDAYPAYSQFNHSATVIGMHAGIRLLIDYEGKIQVGAQRGDETGADWNGYAPLSAAGTVPLGRWVDVAVAADRDNAKVYAYVDGEPLQLYDAPVPSGQKLRDPTGYPFTIGDDDQDSQPFTGKIDEVRVSNNLVLGRGLEVLPPSSDPGPGPGGSEPKGKATVVADADALLEYSVPGYPDNGRGNKNYGKRDAFGTGAYDVYTAARMLVHCLFALLSGKRRGVKGLGLTTRRLGSGV